MFLKKLVVRLKYAYLRFLEEGIFWTLTQVIIRAYKFLIYILLLPVTFTLRILGYRFLTVNTARIGHLVGEVDCFLKMQDLGLINAGYKYFIFNNSIICNIKFWEYIKKKILTIDNPILCCILRYMCFGPGVRFNVFDYLLALNQPAKYYEVCRSWGERPPIFSLDTGHIASGVKILNALGVPIGEPYICIHIRTSGFSTKDDLVHQHRNFQLSTFKEAIDEILSRGYYCILMGDSSAQRISISSKVIDYAHSEYKSDMMDVFLCATAKFFLGNSSGLFILSTAFGTPCALSNMLPFACTGFTKKDISIPKILKNSITGEYLKYSQILENGVANYRNAKQYEMSGIEVISNSGIDIRNLVCDMFAFLDQKISSNEITRKNNYFLNKLQPNNYCFETSSYMAPSFIEKYNDIFDS
jgi:putative glycosyltransferase (TIGR04372 family)